MRKKQLTAKEHAARDCHLHQAKLVAHQEYLGGLNPDSLKAVDARRQIRFWEEELRIKTERIASS